MAGIDDLISGKFFDALLSPFIATGFPAEMFYLFFLGTAIMLIYMKTRNLGITSLTLTLVSVVLIPRVVPATQQYFWALMFFGIVGLIYSLFKGR